MGGELGEEGVVGAETARAVAQIDQMIAAVGPQGVQGHRIAVRRPDQGEGPVGVRGGVLGGPAGADVGPAEPVGPAIEFGAGLGVGGQHVDAAGAQPRGPVAAAGADFEQSAAGQPLRDPVEGGAGDGRPAVDPGQLLPARQRRTGVRREVVEHLDDGAVRALATQRRVPEQWHHLRVVDGEFDVRCGQQLGELAERPSPAGVVEFAALGPEPDQALGGLRDQARRRVVGRCPHGGVRAPCGRRRRSRCGRA
ncbi:hypothetical protein [Kitasatospora sp. NPDC048407]|uniref:hypothetical protein n=1 Tax=Kitasatospora sp. NPDC048407 TaxID=3364051 RepID=UPI003721354F